MPRYPDKPRRTRQTPPPHTPGRQTPRPRLPAHIGLVRPQAGQGVGKGVPAKPCDPEVGRRVVGILHRGGILRLGRLVKEEDLGVGHLVIHAHVGKPLGLDIGHRLLQSGVKIAANLLVPAAKVQAHKARKSQGVSRRHTAWHWRMIAAQAPHLIQPQGQQDEEEEVQAVALVDIEALTQHQAHQGDRHRLHGHNPRPSEGAGLPPRPGPPRQG